MLWLDAVLAYLHFTAIFILFAFLAIQVVLIKGALDARVVRQLGRMDLWYFGAAAAVATATCEGTAGVLRVKATAPSLDTE